MKIKARYKSGVVAMNFRGKNKDSFENHRDKGMYVNNSCYHGIADTSRVSKLNILLFTLVATVLMDVLNDISILYLHYI